MPAMPAMPGMPAMNPLLMSMLFKDGSSNNDDLLMMMMMGGNMGQMNPLMLSLLFDSDDYASLKKICDAQTNAVKKDDCKQPQQNQHAAQPVQPTFPYAYPPP